MQKTPGQYIELRLNLLEQVKSRVRLIEGEEDPELRSYFLPYKKELHDQKWLPVQRSLLIGDLLQADIVIGGDFHAFAQSQRTHLRMIRSLKKLNRPLILALECFESKHQEILDKYLLGHLSQEEFLETINWAEDWGFPWKNYWPLVKFAKLKGHKILAVNSKSHIDSGVSNTDSRDQHIAKIINNEKLKTPTALVYLVIGDLHLANEHMPAALLNKNSSFDIISVFQNSEKIYFDLLSKGLENKVDILKSNKKQYCIITSPPWVKWQSYLMYLETNDDIEIFNSDFEEEFDDDLGEDDYDDFVESYEFTDQLYSIFNFLVKDLDLNISFDNAESFTTVTDFLLDQFNEKLATYESNMAKLLVENSKSFYLPELGCLYLSRLTTNHASEIVGKYIQAELTGRKESLFSMPGDFKKLIWVETLAYFMSKIYNHKRKTMSFKNLKSELLTINPSDSNHEILKLSLGQTMDEYFSVNNIKRKKKGLELSLQPYSYIESARILGQFKGEQLHQAYRGGRMSKETLKVYMSKKVSDNDFEEFYQFIVKRLLSKRSAKDKREYIL